MTFVPLGNLMSGHSKWSQIKRKKAAVDEKKGKVFSKLARTIEIAARKGADPKTNFTLREVIEKAKAANMPALNIERAIKKGDEALSAKGGPAAGWEEIWYEAYGPGGVAILIKTITQNRNRTVAELKHILSKNGGVLAEAGSVKWQFDEKGGAKFPVAAQEKDAAALRNLLAELEGEEDVQEIFTNQK